MPSKGRLPHVITIGSMLQAERPRRSWSNSYLDGAAAAEEPGQASELTLSSRHSRSGSSPGASRWPPSPAPDPWRPACPPAPPGSGRCNISSISGRLIRSKTAWNCRAPARSASARAELGVSLRPRQQQLAVQSGDFRPQPREFRAQPLDFGCRAHDLGRQPFGPGAGTTAPPPRPASAQDRHDHGVL